MDRQDKWSQQRQLNSPHPLSRVRGPGIQVASARRLDRTKGCRPSEVCSSGKGRGRNELARGVLPRVRMCTTLPLLLDRSILARSTRGRWEI